MTKRYKLHSYSYDLNNKIQFSKIYVRFCTKIISIRSLIHLISFILFFKIHPHNVIFSRPELNEKN
jgi:hypothetical protein